jgi:hypothetical protein
LAVLLEVQPHGWVEVGRTEAVSNNNNPSFIKKFRIRYNFEEIQSYRLLLIDVDKQHNPEKVDYKECVSRCYGDSIWALVDSSSSCHLQDQLGNVDFKLSDLVTAQNRCLTLVANNTASNTTVSIF